LPNSSEEIYVSGREIHKSGRKIHKSAEEIGISLPDLCISGSKLPISSRELGNFFFPTTQPKAALSLRLAGRTARLMPLAGATLNSPA